MPTEVTDFAARGVSPADPTALPAAGLSIRGVSHAYGELQTLDAVRLEVGADGVIGLVEPWGCGKSTLLELICGLQEPPPASTRSAADAASEPPCPLRLHAPARPVVALVLGDR